MAVNDESAAGSPVSTPRAASATVKGQPARGGVQSAVSGARREMTIADEPADLTGQQATTEIPEALARRVIVERIEPEIDAGRFPIKRTPGETVAVSATIFADGHDVIAAVVCDRSATGAAEAVPDERPTGGGTAASRGDGSSAAHGLNR